MSADGYQVPPLQFSHMGICTHDLPAMEAFYTEVLGFTVTDRGNALGCDLVFLSRDPMEHHQIVLGTGRPGNLPTNVANPMFGPCINQISFALPDLANLREMERHLVAHYPQGERIHANHGTAWSIYVHDPEGNFLEFFVDTEWYCAQPVFEPLDLSLSDPQIAERTEQLARTGRDFRPMAEWRAEVARRMQPIPAR